MTLKIQNLGLVVCLLVCGHLSYLNFTNPNPSSKTPYAKDRLATTMSTMAIRRYLFSTFWCHHTLLILSPECHSSMCLNPDLLSPYLFVWSAYTTTLITVIFIAAPIRLLAFAQLGENFTFELAKPTRLVQTGLYRYVQHPSYTSLCLITSDECLFLLRLDGIATCFFPAALVNVQGVGVSIVGRILTILTFAGMAIRIRDEEWMLKKEFEKEWETYHSRTKRFIPGIF